MEKITGLTLVEVLVSVVILGLVGVISIGFIVPLRATRESGRESQALGIARTYIETTKARWQDPKTYRDTTNDYGLPTVGTAASDDIILPSNWTLEVIDKSNWEQDDTIRTLTVKVSPDAPTNPVQLTLQVARP
jgi:type II secretory pathway pseudopilin PulG